MVGLTILVWAGALWTVLFALGTLVFWENSDIR